MKPACIAIIAALVATAATAGDLKDRIKPLGTAFETPTTIEYTVRFNSPPAGATAAYATYTETNQGAEYVTYTMLRRLTNGHYQLTAIIDHHADMTADVLLMSNAPTLREAYDRLRREDAIREPDKPALAAYERCVRSLLAPRNLVMAAR